MEHDWKITRTLHTAQFSPLEAGGGGDMELVLVVVLSDTVTA